MSDKIVRLALKGAALLDATEAYLGRFVVYPSEHARVAHTLWIAHAHAMDCWESTPRLAFLGPEKGCGKSRALEATEPLVPRPVLGVNFTPAYLFRKVGTEGERPTILHDEFDNLTASKADGAQETRALINAGHRRNAVVGRCIVVGRRVETEEIPAFSAVALAGIGELPDTIGSRAVQIHMQRRAPDEPVEPFRYRMHAPQGQVIREQVSDWMGSIAQQLKDARPEMPHGVEDRAADVWEPLLAIAEAAGGSWRDRSRVAAVVLTMGAAESLRTTGVQLLSDLRDVFGDAEKLPTETLIARLRSLPESTWADIRGKPLDDRGLALRLRKYGVRPKKIRVGDTTPRGYEATDLADAWKRYLPFRPLSLKKAEQTEQRNTSTQTSNEWLGEAEANAEKLEHAPVVPLVPNFLGEDGVLADVPHDQFPELPEFLDRRSKPTR